MYTETDGSHKPQDESKDVLKNTAKDLLKLAGKTVLVTLTAIGTVSTVAFLCRD
jgi:hypothetical protein